MFFKTNELIYNELHIFKKGIPNKQIVSRQEDG